MLLYMNKVSTFKEIFKVSFTPKLLKKEYKQS